MQKNIFLNFPNEVHWVTSLDDENFLKKNLLLPIPQNEIDTNSALEYSDNNFGYITN